MNFNFYIIGTPDGKYSQYPNDYTSSSFLGYTKNLKGARLVIFREMNLFHYIFVEKLHGEDMIGFCLVINNANVHDIHNLVELFRDMVEQRMVYSGNILQYSDTGELKYNTSSFSSCITELKEIHEFIKSELSCNLDKYGIREATTNYNGTRTIGTSNLSLSNDEIFEQTQKHNTVILNDDTGIEGSYIDKLISDFQYKNNDLKNQISLLQEEVKHLTNQKKRLSTVLWLTAVIIIGGIAAAVIVNNKNTQLDEVSNEYAQYKDRKTTEVQKLNTQLDELSNEYEQYKDRKTAEIKKLNTQLDDTKNKLSTLRSQVNSHLPIIITDIEIANVTREGGIINNYGSSIDSNNTMYLKPRISYTALTSGEKTFYVKFYKPDGTMSTGNSSPFGYPCSYSNTIYLYNGEHTTHELLGWGKNERGYWGNGIYRIEIWYENTCLKSKIFKIY